MPTSPDHAEAFRVLYRMHRDDIWRYLRRRTDQDVAEDLTTEVFVVAWRRRSEVPVDPRPWLFAVARNVLLNHRRSTMRAANLIERAGQSSVTEEPDHAPLAGVRADMAAALGQLPHQERELVLLVAWEGLTSAEAAVVLGCRASTARVRLHRARKRLRILLQTLSSDGELTDLEVVR